MNNQHNYNQHKHIDNSENDTLIEIERGLEEEEVVLLRVIIELYSEHEKLEEEYNLNLEENKAYHHRKLNTKQEEKTKQEDNSKQKEDNREKRLDRKKKVSKQYNETTIELLMDEQENDRVLLKFIDIRKKRTLLKKQMQQLVILPYFEKVYNESQKQKYKRIPDTN